MVPTLVAAPGLAMMRLSDGRRIRSWKRFFEALLEFLFVFVRFATLALLGHEPLQSRWVLRHGDEMARPPDISKDDRALFDRQ